MALSCHNSIDLSNSFDTRRNCNKICMVAASISSDSWWCESIYLMTHGKLKWHITFAKVSVDCSLRAFFSIYLCKRTLVYTWVVVSFSGETIIFLQSVVICTTGYREVTGVYTFRVSNFSLTCKVNLFCMQFWRFRKRIYS